MRNLNHKLLFFCWILSILCIQSNGVSFEEDVTLTAEQKKTLDAFKKLVINRLPQEYMKESIYLIKFLRARDFNIQRAEEYLMKNLEWRKQNNMDSIQQEDWSEFYKEYKYYLGEGHDKEFRPILYLDVGGMDLRRTIIRGQSDQFLRFVDKALDDACGLVRELGEKYHNVTRGNLIINVDGFTLMQQGCLRCIPLLLRVVTSYEEHFPMCADKIILLNTPGLADPLINAARPLLSRDTNRALKIYGTNKKDWWDKLLGQEFDRDQLPIQIGGTKIYKGLETNDDYNL